MARRGRNRRNRNRRNRRYSSYGSRSSPYRSLLDFYDRDRERRHNSSNVHSYGPSRPRDYAYNRDFRLRVLEYDRRRRAAMEARRRAREEPEERMRREEERRERERATIEERMRREREERERELREARDEEALENERRERESLEELGTAMEERVRRARARLEEERRKEREREERERKEEEERLKKEKEEKEKREKEEKERREREASERENKRALEVKSVDLHIKDNAERHHTDKYELTQLDKGRELVIRRGQPFTMDVVFDQAYDVKQHDLRFIFVIGENPRPRGGTMETMNMDEDGKEAKKPDVWHARLMRRHGNSITVEIRPACDCIIGEWSLAIDTKAQNASGDVKFDRYEHPDDINILLNPWCPDDAVYMRDEKLLNEYVLNDQGAIFSGSYNGLSAKVWNFGQFEDGILEICFALLRKGNRWEVNKKLSMPKNIARIVSHVINSCDDDEGEGVLIGNWSGDYSGGVRPTLWPGSVKILKRWAETGEAVKFGQCWVFSGITTTVCRALGLPAKSVTCFNSAHDTDESTTKDEVFRILGDGDPVKDEYLSADSIWNFHVWNEVFMKRPDLGDQQYDGWQVIDATPQEAVDGLYVCGPASVRAIKQGHCQHAYETKFVFAEVNSDVIKWHVDGNNRWTKVEVDTTTVGKKIMSKVPDGEPYTGYLTIPRYGADVDKHDVTDHYKYPEGSNEERIAVKNAGNSSTAHRSRGLDKPPQKTVEIHMEEIEDVMTGEDFVIKFRMKNVTDKTAMTLTKVKVTLCTKKYTGDMHATVIKKSLPDVKIQSGKEETIELKVTSKDYLPKLVEQGNMEARLTAKVMEIDEYIMKSEKFRLRRPDIDITAPEKVKLGDEFEATLTFKNHMPIPLTQCSLIMDGAGFEIRDTIKLKDVPEKSEWSYKVKMKPKRKGHEQFVASFDCKELPDIIGRADLYVY